MNLWAFCTSPHGLSLTTQHFWRLTPGMFAALKRQWRFGQDRLAVQLAWIRADIHNAWMHEKGKPAKSALDFLPGKKPQRAGWMADKAIFEFVADSKHAIRPQKHEKEAALAKWMEAAVRRRQQANQAA